MIGVDESVEFVLRECRLVPGRSELLALLPGIEYAVPPLHELRFDDGDFTHGYPVLPSAPLARALSQCLGSLLGAALEDRDLPPVEGVSDPFVRVLADLGGRARASGAGRGLTGVLHLQIAGLTSAFFDSDSSHPDRAALDRLAAANPVRASRVRSMVVSGVLDRVDTATDVVDSWVGVSTLDLLRRALRNTLILFTESVDGLHDAFDLTPLFATAAASDQATWEEMRCFFSAIVCGAHERDATGTATVQDAWFLERFAPAAVLSKAASLELNDAAGEPSDGSSAERLAWLLCLQTEAMTYLAHHVEAFLPKKRPSSIGAKAWKRFAKPGVVLRELPGYLEVCSTVLRWDFFNALRSFVEPVETLAGLLSIDGRTLARETAAIDFGGTGELLPRRRWGTVVAVEVVDFSRTVEAMLLEGPEFEDRTPVVASDGDFAALCLQAVYSVRSNLAAWKGRAQSFSEGRTLDLFDRPLDGLRYAIALREDVLRRARQAPGPFRESRANPFARALRIGLATGDYAAVSVPDPRVENGGSIQATGSLVAQAAGLLLEIPGVRPGKSATDPLGIHAVVFKHGELHNEGICSSGVTLNGILSALAAEGVPRWTPGSSVQIGGRDVALGEYELAAVFEDEVTKRVVMIRPLPGLLGLVDGPLFEYTALEPELFATFLDRLSRRPATAGSSNAPETAPLPSHSLPPEEEPPYVDPDVEPRSAEGRFLGGNAILGAARATWSPEEGFMMDDHTTPPIQEPPVKHPPGPVGALDLPDIALPLLAPRADRISTFDEASMPSMPFVLDEDPAPLEVELPDAAEDRSDEAGFGDESLSFLDLIDDIELPPKGGAAEPPSYAKRKKLPRRDPSSSLLGAVQSSLSSRIAALEQRLSEPRPARVAPKVAPPRPAVPRPDFQVLFKDYILFRVGLPDGTAPWIGIGRRYRDVLFDLHRFDAPPSDPNWGPDDAVVAFLRAKAATKYAPQSLSYERLPAGAQSQMPLTVERLERAFDQLGDAR
jgi:hypothetical protein